MQFPEDLNNLGQENFIDSFNHDNLQIIMEQITNLKNVVVAEIAGRDSFAAIFKSLEENDFQNILATACIIPTENGDWNEVKKNYSFLADELTRRSKAKLLPLTIIGSPRLWASLCGLFTNELIKRYGFYTPCISCHLYLHLSRAPIALLTDTKTIIAGERVNHDGKIKINQIDIVLDAYKQIFQQFDINIQFPIRNISNNDQITEILERDWAAEENQLECVFSGNYLDKQGNLNINPKMLEPYLKEFFIPAGIAILKDFSSGKNLDPEAAIKEVL